MNIFNKTFWKYTPFLHQNYKKGSISKFKFQNSKISLAPLRRCLPALHALWSRYHHVMVWFGELCIWEQKLKNQSSAHQLYIPYGRDITAWWCDLVSYVFESGFWKSVRAFRRWNMPSSCQLVYVWHIPGGCFMAWFLCYIILNQRSSAGIITHCSMLIYWLYWLIVIHMSGWHRTR